MKIGYIRVSKHEQNEALQRDALKEASCEKYFSDVITGSKFERKAVNAVQKKSHPLGQNYLSKPLHIWYTFPKPVNCVPHRGLLALRAAPPLVLAK